MIDQMSGDFLQWVRGFYYVADRGSVTQAALAMGREQPTITHQIKRLESELGVTLFDRASGRMELTPDGRILLDKAVSLFEIVREIKSEFQSDQYQGRIVIAASHGIIDTFLPTYIAKFRNAHPQMDFHMLGGVYQAVVENVESAEADFGICNIDSIPNSIITHELFETGVVLIAGKNRKFFANRVPTLKEIASAPLVLFSGDGKMEPVIAKPFAEAGLTPEVVLTLNNPVSLKKYVAMGIGVGLVSGLTITDEDRMALDIYNMDRFFPKRKYGLLLRHRKHFTRGVRAFIREIKADIAFN